MHEVAIVGAGPAGLSAAIQLRRYGLSPLLFERRAVGGLLRNANKVENYPGFPAGISGQELVRLFKQQLEQARVQVTLEEVKSISYSKQMFHVITPVRTYCCGVAVVASGTRPRTFTDFQIPASLNDKVTYEIYELLDMQDKRVVIVGGGDVAFDYALTLSRKNQVIVLNRSERRRCIPLLWESTRTSRAITYWENTCVTDIVEEPNGVMVLECVREGRAVQLRPDFLIGAMGRTPRLEFLADSLRGEPDTLKAAGNFHLIGDVASGVHRQTAIAVGHGVRAAMQIHEYLSAGEAR